MNGSAKKCAICCGAIVVLGIFVIFCMCMAAYVNLGPDEQVLLTSPTGKYVVNGPWGGQLHITYPKEHRKATVLDPMEYVIVEDTLSAELRQVIGPTLLFLGPYEKVKAKKQKIVLQRDEYVRLVENRTGEERVVDGPGTVVPAATEFWTKIESAVFVNVGTAVVVRNRRTGYQSLITHCDLVSGVWYPQNYEELVDVRELVYVLPHEAVVVRDVNGTTTVYNGRETSPKSATRCTDEGAKQAGVGGISFFLPPYSKIMRMKWSSFENPRIQQRRLTPKRFPTKANPRIPKHSSRIPREEVYLYEKQERRLQSIYVDQVGSSAASGPKQTVVSIDMRSQKEYYSYEVRTNDNVRLMLYGTIFWKLENVMKMLATTSDPPGDVWTKCRSLLIAAVSKVTFETFMAQFNDVVLQTFDAHMNSTFWQDRGIKVISIEMTNYEPVDEFTRSTLQTIIRQTVKRVNLLQRQRSDNDVAKEKLGADTHLEVNKTSLLVQQALNSEVLSRTVGDVEGGKTGQTIASFIDALGQTISNTSDRMSLFKQYRQLQAAEMDAEQLMSGQAALYMTPEDLELRLQMPPRRSSSDVSAPAPARGNCSVPR